MIVAMAGLPTVLVALPHIAPLWKRTAATSAVSPRPSGTVTLGGRDVMLGAGLLVTLTIAWASLAVDG